MVISGVCIPHLYLASLFAPRNKRNSMSKFYRRFAQKGTKWASACSGVPQSIHRSTRLALCSCHPPIFVFASIYHWQSRGSNQNQKLLHSPDCPPNLGSWGPSQLISIQFQSMSSALFLSSVASHLPPRPLTTQGTKHRVRPIFPTNSHHSKITSAAAIVYYRVEKLACSHTLQPPVFRSGFHVIPPENLEFKRF